MEYDESGWGGVFSFLPARLEKGEDNMNATEIELTETTSDDAQPLIADPIKHKKELQEFNKWLKTAYEDFEYAVQTEAEITKDIVTSSSIRPSR
jgi:hypothetical protein